MVCKYHELLKLCFEYYPELRDDDIKVIHDGMPFCANVESNEIHIEYEMNNRELANKLLDYIKVEFKLDMNKIPIEIFAFFHEVGHVFHNYIYYTFYEDCINEYINLNEGDFRCYRDIYYEYLSDIFATDMILNYEKEILNIIN